MNPGRSLFLLYALKSSPRLGLLYLYLFDYTDTFLPFIHTICPLQEGGSSEDIITRLLVGLQRALGRVLLPSLGSGELEMQPEPVGEEPTTGAFIPVVLGETPQKKIQQEPLHSRRPVLFAALHS